MGATYRLRKHLPVYRATIVPSALSWNCCCELPLQSLDLQLGIFRRGAAHNVQAAARAVMIKVLLAPEPSQSASIMSVG